MNNELIKHKRNWKWFVPLSAILLILSLLFISSGMIGVSADLVKTYSDTELYKNAPDKVKSDQRVIELLGEIEPIDKLAIIEGEVRYTNHNQSVNSSVRIKGPNGKARMDITAEKINNKWEYKKINVRIKNPPENKQTIEINTME